MIITDKEISGLPVQNSRFKLAGFMSLFNGLLTVPMFFTAIIALSKSSAGIWFFILIPQAAISCVLTIYVFQQFKRLLVERYNIHNISSMISILIFCSIIINVKNFLTAIFMVIFPDPGVAGVLDSIIGIPCFMLVGLIGIIIGVRLLRINIEPPSGQLRTYSIVLIICSVCFLSVILILIAFLLSMVNSIILGILFLKEAETEQQVEFV
jgi:hypothetical protein